MVMNATRSIRNMIQIIFRTLTFAEVDQSLFCPDLGDIFTFAVFGKLVGYFEVLGSR